MCFSNRTASNPYIIGPINDSNTPEAKSRTCQLHNNDHISGSLWNLLANATYSNCLLTSCPSLINYLQAHQCYRRLHNNNPCSRVNLLSDSSCRNITNSTCQHLLSCYCTELYNGVLMNTIDSCPAKKQNTVDQLLSCFVSVILLSIVISRTKYLITWPVKHVQQPLPVQVGGRYETLSSHKDYLGDQLGCVVRRVASQKKTFKLLWWLPYL